MLYLDDLFWIEVTCQPNQTVNAMVTCNDGIFKYARVKAEVVLSGLSVRLIILNLN